MSPVPPAALAQGSPTGKVVQHAVSIYVRSFLMVGLACCVPNFPIEMQTPPSAITLGPSTPATRSSAHKRGARRSLFGTPTKKKPCLAIGDDVPPEQPSDPVVDAMMDDSSQTAEDEDDENLCLKGKAVAEDKEEVLVPKSKRNNPGSKSGGPGRKQK